MGKNMERLPPGFGEVIRNARVRKNLLGDELAKLMDVSSSYVRKLEQDLSQPRNSTIIKLCKILNITPTDLFAPYLFTTEDPVETDEEIIRAIDLRLTTYTSIELQEIRRYLDFQYGIRDKNPKDNVRHGRRKKAKKVSTEDPTSNETTGENEEPSLGETASD